MEQRGIADLQSIENIAKDCIGFMKGYKNKLRGNKIKFLQNGLSSNLRKAGINKIFVKSQFIFVY